MIGKLLMCTLSLNLEGYRNAVRSGECSPPGIMAPFITVDPKLYYQLRKEEEKERKGQDVLPIRDLQARMTTEQYANTIGAVSLTLNHAMTFFPAYRFFISDFLKAEWLALVNWEGFHRDHIVHQSLTAYIGMSLLKKLKFDDGKYLLDKCVDVFLSPDNFFYQYLGQGRSQIGQQYLDPDNLAARLIWKDIFLDIFFLAATFHDMGYPWKFVNIIHDKLGSHSPLTDPSGQGAEWITERYKNRLLFAPFRGYTPAMPCDPAHWHDNLVELVRLSLTKTHGFPGAVSFLHLNDILRKYPDNNHNTLRQFCLEWAAVAIMMHDMGGIYKNKNKNHRQLRISFACDPISFVLTLSDIMQDFGRANATFFHQPETSHSPFPPSKRPVDLNYEHKCKNVDFSLKENKINITYSYRQQGDCLRKKVEFIPKEQENLFNHTNGYLDYSTLGIKQITLDAKVC